MHRFHLSNNLLQRLGPGDVVELPIQAARQVANVLRMKQGDMLALFDGDGSEWHCRVGQISTDRGLARVVVSLISRFSPDVELPIRVTMAMALTRAERYEQALAKCTELGASSFLPMVSERVQRRDATVKESRYERWKKIVSEATELSGRVAPPVVRETVLFERAIVEMRSRGVPTVLLWEESKEAILFERLTLMKDSIASSGSLALVIGPVGGFTADEARRAISQGAVEASLGRLILRTETAAISSMAVASQLWT